MQPDMKLNPLDKLCAHMSASASATLNMAMYTPHYGLYKLFLVHSASTSAQTSHHTVIVL